MPYRNEVFDCTNCATVRSYRPVPLDHRLHLCMTIVTMGLWLPFYLIGAAKRFRLPGSCPMCGKVPNTMSSRNMVRSGVRQTIEY
jgi:hypothetical protein